MHLYLSAALLGAALVAAPVAATTTIINFNTETQNNVASLIYPGVTITALGDGTVFTSTYGNGPNGTVGVLARMCHCGRRSARC